MLAVTHVVEDFSPANSGVTTAVYELAGLMLRHGVGSDVLAAGDGAAPAIEGLRAFSAPIARLGRGWRRAPALREGLLSAIRAGAIPHIHGLWMYPQWMAARECAGKARPFVITP